MLKKLAFFSVILFTGMLILGEGYCQESSAGNSASQSEIKKAKVWGVSGEVSAIDRNFIAVIYRRDENQKSQEEIGLVLPKNVKVEHVGSVQDIKPGDIVEVQYEEMEVKAGKGKSTSRVAKVVRFVRGPQNLPTSSVLGSGAMPEDENAAQDQSGTEDQDQETKEDQQE